MQKTRFKHVLRRICHGKCVLNLFLLVFLLVKLMLVRKIFLTLFLCPENFLEKKGLAKKKISTQAKMFEKMIVQVGNGPPPPPITFLMVRPLDLRPCYTVQFFLQLAMQFYS